MKFETIKNQLLEAGNRTGLKLVNGYAMLSKYGLEKHIQIGPDERNSLDYYSTNDVHCKAIIIFLYGGNWSSGQKEEYRFVAETLCRHGFDVAIPDYRLYPEVRFAEILDDVTAAVHWVLSENTQQLPVFVMGHSAGAQLGSLVCLNNDLLAAYGSSTEMINGFVGLAGPYDFYPFSEQMHYDLFAPEEDYTRSQPVNYVQGAKVPLLLLHGKEDRRVRRGHSRSLMLKIQQAGGMAERKVYDGMGHIEIIVAFSGIFQNRWPVTNDVVSYMEAIVSQQTSA